MSQDDEILRWLEARCPALVAAALPVAVQLSEASQPVAAQPSETAEPVAAQHSEVSQPVAAQPPAESQHDTRHLEAAQAYAVKLPWFTPPCPSYERWLPHVCGPLEPLRQSRGSQRRVYLHASICSGMGPESKIGDLTAQKHHSVFNCDQKAWAVKWQQDNNADRPDHFFSELRGLADLGQSIWTAEGTKVVLAQLIANGILQKPDHFHAGVSCRGYSFARSGRAADIWSHEDTFMIEEFLNLVELVESPVSTLENVGVFLKTDTKSGESPLYRLMKRAEEKGMLAKFRMYVVITNGSFLVWERCRCWIMFFWLGQPNVDKVILDYFAMLQDTPRKAIIINLDHNYPIMIIFLRASSLADSSFRSSRRMRSVWKRPTTACATTSRICRTPSTEPLRRRSLCQEPYQMSQRTPSA